MKKIVLFICALFLAITACKKEPIRVLSISLSRTTLELIEGDSETLIATILPEDANDKTVVWASSDSKIASVTNGKIQAISQGKATITATADEKSACCSVYVIAKVIPVESIVLDKTSIELTEGEDAIVTATVKPDNATDKTVIWRTSDSTVATIKDGKISAISAGTATITAQAGSKSATCSMIVKTSVVPVESVSLDKTTLELVVGQDSTLVATITPCNASNKNIIWSSSDNAIASVDTTGKVIAIADGTATIRATSEDGGKYAECAVTVSHQKTYAELIIGEWSQNKLDSYSANGELIKTETFTDVAVLFRNDGTCRGLISFNSGAIVPDCPYEIVGEILRITSPFVVEFYIETLNETEFITKTNSLAGTGDYSICYYIKK